MEPVEAAGSDAARLPAETEPPAGPLSTPRQWARGAPDAHAVATSLARTAFVPREMQNKPELVTAAILTGAELGLSPMAALRSIDIIQGVPAMRANTMRGLVQAAGHEVWVDDDSNETRAIVYGRRKGSDIVQRSVWTMDRARNLGLANRDNYRKQPGAMLVARGTAEVCRLIAADVLLGMPYAVEELDEGEPESKPRPKSAPAKRRTAKRKPVEAPELDEPEPPERAAESDAEPADEPPAPDPAGGESS